MIRCRSFCAAALVVLMAMSVSACTLAPRYTRPVAPVASQYPSHAAAQDTGAADIAWRDFITEDRLRSLIDLALVDNRDLRIAVLNVAQSRAQYRVIRSSLFPTIDANTSFARSHSPNPFAGLPSTVLPISAVSGGFTTSEWNASIGANSYEVDLFGRVRSLSRQALEQYFASVEAQRGAKVSLIAEVATEYFALRQAEEQLHLARHTLASVQQAYDLNQAKFNAGESNELDLRTAEGQVQTAKVNIVIYERSIDQMRNALALLIGGPLPDDLPSASPFSPDGLLIDILPGLPSELIDRRPDILEAEHTLKAADANIGAARAAFFPSISLTGSYGTTSSQLSQLFGAGTGVWSFMPQITLPIFAGGRNAANLEIAKITSRVDIANYEKSIQTAFREEADALIGVETYATEFKERSALTVAEQRRFDLADERYRHGEDSYLNVLTAQQDLYSAQQSQLVSLFNKLSSQIALYQALGGGWK